MLKLRARQIIVFIISISIILISGGVPQTAYATGNNYAHTDTTQADFSGWYNPSWQYRQKITIDHTKVDTTDQTNFPVLISLSGLSNINANGTDVRFTSGDGVTELAREIESYSGGNLTVWVKVTTLSASVDTILYMYYGNAGATEPAAGSIYGKNSVWDSNFKMVQHMSDATTSTITDSTSNGNIGTKVASNQPSEAAGFINKDQNFNNNYINLGNKFDTSYNSSQTYSLWIKTTNTSSNSISLISKEQINSPWTGWTIEILASGSIRYQVYDSGGANRLGKVLNNNSVQDGNWHYITVSKGDNLLSNLHIYIDGVEPTASSTFNTLTTNVSTSVNLQIGARDGGNTYFLGDIDETRISSNARSVNWVKTEYNNQSSPSTFYTVGSQENQATSSLSLNTQATSIGDLQLTGGINETFSGDLSAWRPDVTDFGSIVGGVYDITSSSSSQGITSLQGASGDGYIEADIKLMTNNELWLSVAGVRGGFSFGNIYLQGLGANVSVPFAFSLNTWYRMRVQVSGGVGKVYINNVQKLSTALSQSPGNWNATMYVWTTGAHGQFDNCVTGFTSSGNYISTILNLSTVNAAQASIISWNAITPANTSLTVDINLSNDGGTNWAGWQTVTNGSAILGISSGTNLSNGKLQYRVTLSTTDTTVTPQLNDITINITAQALPPAAAITTMSNAIMDEYNFGDGRDIRVMFKGASDESKILEYRIIAVKVALTEPVASGLDNTKYQVEPIKGKGRLHLLNLKQASKDSDGADITGGISYTVYALSVGKTGYSNTLTSLGTISIGTNNVGNAVTAPTPAAADIANNGNGLDLRVTFKKSQSEVNIAEYRIIVSTIDLTPATAATVPAIGYKQVTPTSTGIAYTVTMGATQTDNGGMTAIKNDVAYKIYVWVIGKNNYANVLSTASKPITLKSTVPAALPVRAFSSAKVGTGHAGSNISVTFNEPTSVTNVQEYRIFICTGGGSLDLATANGINDNTKYIKVDSIEKGVSHTVTLTGLPVYDGTALAAGDYKAYILTIGKTSQYANRLIGPSKAVNLD